MATSIDDYYTHELVRPVAFKAVLQYLYTGRLETHKDFAEDCIRFAKQCQLPTLIQQLEDTVKEVYSFECTKPGTNVTTILIEPPVGSNDLQQDFGILAEQKMPLQLIYAIIVHRKIYCDCVDFVIVILKIIER